MRKIYRIRQDLDNKWCVEQQNKFRNWIMVGGPFDTNDHAITWLGIEES